MKMSSNHSADLDQQVFTWFCQMRSMGYVIQGPQIKAKALKIAASIGFDGFQANEGWLTRFKNRHSIHGVKLTGERGSVDQETVSSFKVKLPTLLQGYSPEDIWNSDETGLFFRTVPDRSLRLLVSKARAFNFLKT